MIKFYCNLCQSVIYPKNNSLVKNTNEFTVNTLANTHHRHKHFNYREEIELGYKYYIEKGFPPVVAGRKAKDDAREKWMREKNKLKNWWKKI